MRQTLMETDTADILNELIYCCRKGGTIACIGVYVGLVNGCVWAAVGGCGPAVGRRQGAGLGRGLLKE